MAIPFTADRIINSSMDDFNGMLVGSALTEEQITTCRDIRRRGKNKIAAQNCRKRKVSNITPKYGDQLVGTTLTRLYMVSPELQTN